MIELVQVNDSNEITTISYPSREINENRGQEK